MARLNCDATCRCAFHPARIAAVSITVHVTHPHAIAAATRTTCTTRRWKETPRTWRTSCRRRSCVGMLCRRGRSRGCSDAVLVVSHGRAVCIRATCARAVDGCHSSAEQNEGAPQAWLQIGLLSQTPHATHACLAALHYATWLVSGATAALPQSALRFVAIIVLTLIHHHAQPSAACTCRRRRLAMAAPPHVLRSTPAHLPGPPSVHHAQQLPHAQHQHTAPIISRCFHSSRAMS